MSDPKTYADKLRDPRWQKKRLEIFTRDGWTCRDCGSKEKTLSVHHCYYITQCPPWDHPASILLAVCEDCHKERQEKEGAAHLLLAEQLAQYPITRLTAAVWHLLAEFHARENS